jgi:hypothetical protein
MMPFWRTARFYQINKPDRETPVRLIRDDSARLSVLGKPVFYTIHKSFFAEILKLSSIKEGSFTDTAGFKLDVRLLQIMHTAHTHITDRTVNLPFLIKSATFFRVAGINRSRPFALLNQIFRLKRIEPQSAAAFALVVFGSLIFSFLHFIFTLRTLHNGSLIFLVYYEWT